VGFWLGLILFVVILLLPPPRSMHEAARERFADDLPGDAAVILQHLGEPQAPADSQTYARAEALAVQGRARIMMCTAAVTALVACWWIFTALPIPVTSLLPLALFPLVGVFSVSEAAVPYANNNVFLFMGGFIIALAIERWNLHRRIALHIVHVVGTGRSTIVLGFMIASAFLSMWISNTATVMMMLPIGRAVITAIMDIGEGERTRADANFGPALMLGIAYAASIGGLGTPIGTPPNIAFRGQFRELFPGAPEISFGLWVVTFVPLVIVFVPITWLILTRVTCRVGLGRIHAGREMVRRQIERLGPMRRPEIATLIIFVVTGLLWMTRSIPIGDDDNYGWAFVLDRLLAPESGAPRLFRAGYINDATVAICMALLLFAIPAGRNESGRRCALMNWQTAVRLPWGILLLFGGGFSIAAAFQASGLSFWCGTVFSGLGIESPLWLVVGTCLLMTFLTEITSNTATTQVMLPIIAKVSQAMNINPLTLMLPATLSASCAFMLPVATPPNAIVFGSGHVTMGRMVRSGIILNFVGAALITALIYLVAKPLLDIGPQTPAHWMG
jgi:sodium-dependent dicarboxylate transporter 2/3/5